MADRLAFLAASLLVAVSSHAWAQTSPEPLRITITKQDCSRLVRHQPAADVAFKPGEGVKGRKVAPADLSGSGGEMTKTLVPDVLEIPITVNPVGYGARVTAQKARSEAAAAVTANDAALATAQTRGTALAAEKTALDTQYNTYMATYTAAQDKIVELTGGATPSLGQSTVRTQQLEDLRKRYLVYNDTYTKLVEDRTAKAAEITTNNASVASLQANKVPLRTAYDETEYAATAADAKWAAIGLDRTSTTVATVKYDFAKGVFTLNDQPLGGAEQQDLTEKCRAAGVR